ncbi:MAG: hypothetical protein J6R77_03355 [Clostridia bacterium]|nr:hypothetical protein [Clostridia bacterium]
MKKTTTGWIVAFFSLQALFPLLCLVVGFTDYYLVLRHGVVTAVAVTAPAVVLTVILCMHKDRSVSVVGGVLVALSPILALVGSFLFFVKSEGVMAGAVMLLGVICAFVLVARLFLPVALRVVTVIVSLLVALPLGCFSFLLLMFSALDGARTTVAEIPSPNGTYCASIIDSDQGALGGDTLVTVTKQADTVDLYFFTFETASQTVYVGEWLEYQRMHVYWKSDEVLVIHGKEYPIA